ncbi:MAG: T9SS type A sorting domain-containing protein, partial [archaeon]
NIWIATDKGLTKFDGAQWITYNTSNSGLLHNVVYSIAIDKYNNKWVCTKLGLSVFNENGVVTSVGDKLSSEAISNYLLLNNYPNPFNPTTTISYSIPKQSFVELKVYDMLGREVSTLVNKEQSAGEYKVQFDGSSLPSGMYIYSLQAGELNDSKKLVLLK